jgi:hypothetical protein
MKPQTIDIDTALTEMLAAYQRSQALYDGTTDTTYTAGGAADTWGRTWSDTELSDGTFRLRLDKSSSSDTLHVDYLTVKVYYTTSGSSTPSYEYAHIN